MDASHNATSAFMRKEGDMARPPSRPLHRMSCLRLSTFFGSCLIFTLVFLATASAQESSSTLTTSPRASSSPSPSTSAVSGTLSIPSLPFTTSLPAFNSTSPSITLTLPSVSSLYITLQICTLGQNTSIIPQAILSTSSPPSFGLGRTVSNPQSGGSPIVNRISRDGDPVSLSFNQGFANYTYTDQEVIGATLLIGLGVDNQGNVNTTLVPASNRNVVVNIDISSDEPLSSISPSWLRLGDTTQNSVLLFSPLLTSSPLVQPSYPNYTLPNAQMPLEGYTGAQTNLTTLGSILNLVIIPTGSSPTNHNLGNSLCAIRNGNSSTGGIVNPQNMVMNATTQWMNIDGLEGYRTMWVVGGLVANTNYTGWMVDDHGGVSQPIWFMTKESTFPCSLVLPNDICPGIGYAAAVSPNSTTSTIQDTIVPYPIQVYPASTVELITSSLNAFSTSLLSQACGRDLFSHVSSCLDCYMAYRDWLCRMTIPQCASSINNTLAPIVPQTINRNESRVNTLQIPYDYTELLPCLSTCNKADRVCPVFLQFRCPVRHVSTALQSYAFLGKDRDIGDGSAETGWPALDQWGNRWCNG